MSSMLSVIVTSFHPFPSISLLLPSSTDSAALSYILAPLCPPAQQSLSLQSGRPLPPANAPLATAHDGSRAPLVVRLAVRLPGGKGGFASQLRAQGGRMSSNKATNNDSCRDLNGRRLSTIKEAQKLAAYISAEPDRKASAALAAQEKLNALNLEIARLDNTSKRRLDDHEFVEESRDIVEGVKDAVKEAMMKKRKKAKLAKEAAAAGTDTADSEPVASGSGSGANVDAPILAESVVEEVAEPAAEAPVEAEEEPVEEVKTVKGKGKGKATKRAKKA
ncbi:hypothetical protein RQP46_000874 [Phenoliferia psychrophenolica]